MMSHKEVTGVEPQYWQAVEGFPGWLVLMDWHNGGKSPRLIVSDQDRYFLMEVCRAHYPGDRLQIVEDGTCKLLARLPAK